MYFAQGMLIPVAALPQGRQVLLIVFASVPGHALPGAQNGLLALLRLR